MKKVAVFTLVLLLALQACAERRSDYMSLSWNQSTKEVISGLAVGDYDGDGMKEIVASSSSEGAVYAFDSGGGRKWKFDIPGYVFTVESVDVEGDGVDDVAVGGGMHLYVVDGQGESRWKYYTGRNPVRRLSGFDADGDGRGDLVYGTFTDECKRSYVSAVDEEGGSLWTYDLGFFYPYVVKSLRVSNGVDWVLVGTVYRAKDTARKSCGPSYKAGASVILLNAKREVVWEHVTVGGVTVIETADLNGDGVMEILVGTYPTLYAIDLAGETLWNYSTVDRVDSLAVGDLNGDGVVEIVVGSNNAYILDANGRELAVATTGSRVYTLKVDDLNADGRSEIIAGSDGVYVFDYKGSRLYQGDKLVSVGDLAVADLNGDEYKEIIAGAVKSVRVYSTGFKSKQQQAQAFYNLARDYYMKGDFENAHTYIEKARKAFFELGDMKSVSASITFRDRIGKTRAGETVVGDVSDVPAFTDAPESFFDRVYAQLDVLRQNQNLSGSPIELIKANWRPVILLFIVLLVLTAVVFAVALMFRNSQSKTGKRKNGKKAGKRGPEKDEETGGGNSRIFEKPPEKPVERPKVKRRVENPKFLKSTKRRSGSKI